MWNLETNHLAQSVWKHRILSFSLVTFHICQGVGFTWQNKKSSFAIPSQVWSDAIFCKSNQSTKLWANSQEKEENDNQEEVEDVKKSKSAKKTKNSFLKSIRQTLQTISDPYEAGYQFRRTLDSALTTLTGTSSEDIPEFYLNDRLFALETNLREYDPDTVPEILVVGATTKLGQLVVQKLLIRGMRVRVLVPNLYSSTLNLFGTNIVYCQGDLSNVESLEYALTDVDKIVFCAGDEEINTTSKHDLTNDEMEQINVHGMNNLLHAYQNVRFVDYGAGQAAKRTLFKFKSRPKDFQLFDIERSSDQENNKSNDYPSIVDQTSFFEQMEREQQGIYADADEVPTTTPKTKKVRNAEWCSWEKNKFGNAIFFGRVAAPNPAKGVAGGEAAIVSTRLRARKKPGSDEQTEPDGIDLSRGFSGLVVRLCGDGQAYECFIRNKAYDAMGVEYVFDVTTLRKYNGTEAVNKFQSVRMPFAEFKPVLRDGTASDVNAESLQELLQRLPKFQGRDIRQIGFRYRSDGNYKQELVPTLTGMAPKRIGRTKGFYLALSYLKLYRSTIEPEFVYVSDSRIPPVVKQSMIRHETRQIVNEQQQAIITDGLDLLVTEEEVRSDEHQTFQKAYYKYLGEQILRHSGLSYAVIRTPGFSDLPTSDITTLQLEEALKEHEKSELISRSEVADVCVSALLDSNALNKSFYLRKSNSREALRSSFEKDLSEKFSRIKSNT